MIDLDFLHNNLNSTEFEINQLKNMINSSLLRMRKEAEKVNDDKLTIVKNELIKQQEEEIKIKKINVESKLKDQELNIEILDALLYEYDKEVKRLCNNEINNTNIKQENTKESVYIYSKEVSNIINKTMYPAASQSHILSMFSIKNKKVKAFNELEKALNEMIVEAENKCKTLWTTEMAITTQNWAINGVNRTKIEFDRKKDDDLLDKYIKDKYKLAQLSLDKELKDEINKIISNRIKKQNDDFYDLSDFIFKYYKSLQSIIESTNEEECDLIVELVKNNSNINVQAKNNNLQNKHIIHDIIRDLYNKFNSFCQESKIQAKINNQTISSLSILNQNS